MILHLQVPKYHCRGCGRYFRHRFAGLRPRYRSSDTYQMEAMALGLGLHTLIDGVALGVALRSDVGHTGAPGLLGLGVFLAIALHKPLDALPITSMMQAGGWVEIWSIDKKSYYGHSSFNSFFKNSR